MSKGVVTKTFKVKAPTALPIVTEDIGDGRIAITSLPEHFGTIVNAKEAGIGRIISLVTKMELPTSLPNWLEVSGIDWTWFPMNYHGGEIDAPSYENARAAVDQVVSDVKAGKGVLVHCFEGIDRSGLVTLSSLLALGQEPFEAMLTLYRMRPRSYARLPIDALLLAGEVSRTVSVDWTTKKVRKEVKDG